VIRAVQFGGAKTTQNRPEPAWPAAGDRTPLLWVIGVDGGATTGVALMAVPYLSIFGDEPGGIAWHESLELTGSLQWRVSSVMYLARKAAERSNGRPALIVYEDFDLGGNRLSGAASQADVIISAREGAAAQYAVECGHADRAVMMFQPRTLAFAATDARLKAWGIYDKGSDHKRDATRHAITMIRRIANGSVKAGEIWTPS
jgi:hypothetical protein